MQRAQAAVGTGLLLAALGLMAGAAAIPGEAGYGGVGPNFLPWLVSVALALCGGLLVWEAASGGFRQMEADNADTAPHWPGFVWVSAGLLLNAGLITRLGFVLSCALCFALAAQGFKVVEDLVPKGIAARAKQLALDALIGGVIAAPVYWMFTKLLAINLPGLTASGWL